MLRLNIKLIKYNNSIRKNLYFSTSNANKIYEITSMEESIHRSNIEFENIEQNETKFISKYIPIESKILNKLNKLNGTENEHLKHINKSIGITPFFLNSVDNNIIHEPSGITRSNFDNNKNSSIKQSLSPDVDLLFTASRIGYPRIENSKRLKDNDLFYQNDNQLKQNIEKITRNNWSNINKEGSISSKKNLTCETMKEAREDAWLIYKRLRSTLLDVEIQHILVYCGKYTSLKRVTDEKTEQLLEKMYNQFNTQNESCEHTELAVIFELYLTGLLNKKKYFTRYDVLLSLFSNSLITQESTRYHIKKDKNIIPPIINDENLIRLNDNAIFINDKLKDNMFQALILTSLRLIYVLSLNLPVKKSSFHCKSILAHFLTQNTENDNIQGNINDYIKLLGLTTFETPFMHDRRQIEDYHLPEILNEAIKTVNDLNDNIKDIHVLRKIWDILSLYQYKNIYLSDFVENIIYEIISITPNNVTSTVYNILAPYLTNYQMDGRHFNNPDKIEQFEFINQKIQASLRTLIETRMRMGHVWVNDIDQNIDSTVIASLNEKESFITDYYDDKKKYTAKYYWEEPAIHLSKHEEVVAFAWNLVGLLPDDLYHIFYGRFLNHKIATRSNRSNPDIFINKIRSIITNDNIDYILPNLKKYLDHLTVEILTICRLRQKYSHKRIEHYARIQRNNENFISNTNDTDNITLNSKYNNNYDINNEIYPWNKEKTVFLTNIPNDVDELFLKNSLNNIGIVNKIYFFKFPIIYNNNTLKKNLNSSNGNTDLKRSRINRRNLKKIIVASTDITDRLCAVEFQDKESKDKILLPACRVFGIVLNKNNNNNLNDNGINSNIKENKKEKRKHLKNNEFENRAIFGTDIQDKVELTLHNIKYKKSAEEILNIVQEAMKPEYNFQITYNRRPKGAIVLNGIIQLKFQTFREAGIVQDRLEKYLNVHYSNTTNNIQNDHNNINNNNNNTILKDTIKTNDLEYITKIHSENNINNNNNNNNKERPFEISWITPQKNRFPHL